MKNYFPDEDAVGKDFPFFEAMIEGIGEYLKGLSDDSMNMNHLCSMKQSPGEQTNDFLVRLHRQGKVCGIVMDEFIRTRFLEGLADRALASMAYQQGWKLDMILHAATRGEAAGSAAPTRTFDEVSAITTSNPDKRGKRKFGVGSGNVEKKLKTADFKGSGSRCSNCNLRFHKFGSCPAASKDCRRCGRVGHFEAACKDKKVAAVAEAKSENDSKVDFLE